MNAITVLDPLGVGRGMLRMAEEAVVDLADGAARRAIRAGLVERVVEELMAEGVVERAIDSAAMERLTARVLDSPGAERLVAQVFDSALLDAVVARVLASEQLWLLIEEIARSSVVADAMAHQGAGFAEQVVGQVGDGTRRADAWLERTARRMLRRPERARPAVPLVP
jgi:hypothetical protein